MKRCIHDPWWHLAGLSAGLLFSLMLMLARLYPGTLTGIDIAVETALIPFQTFGHIELFLAFTALGGIVGISVVALGILALLALHRRHVIAARLVILLLLAGGTMGLAKAFVERARPQAVLWVDPLNSYSFPSGHATLSTALYGFIAVLWYRQARTALEKVLAITLPLLLVVGVAASRLVLNVHYFTDIVAGILLGLFWLAVTNMLPHR